MPETVNDRLAESLLQCEDLDRLGALYVTSSVADEAPAFQGAMRNLWQVELKRRNGNMVEGLPLPDFSKWHPRNVLEAGPAVIGAAEVASQMGDPTLMNFAFRLLQHWFLQMAAQHCETCGATPENAMRGPSQTTMER